MSATRVLSVSDVQRIVTDSGIWTATRAQTHRFQLSTDLFSLPEDRVRELRELTFAVTKCLEGMARIAAIAEDEQLGKMPSWKNIRQTLQREVPARFRSLCRIRASTGPSIVRLDMVEDLDENWKIVEIEGVKSHGLGYSSLFAEIAGLTQHDRLPGVAQLIAQEVHKRRPQNPTLIHILAHSEIFYQAEGEILQKALARHGVRLILLQEDSKIKVEDGILTIEGDGIPNPLFLSIPPFAGKKYGAPANLALENQLLKLYQDKSADCLIPPKLFMGSKGMLAILSNAEENAELDWILRSQINSDNLLLLRSYIPRTALVEPGTSFPVNGGWVLKEVLESGAHGVCFSEEPDFRKKFEEARAGKIRAVLQEKIACKPRDFHVSEGQKSQIESRHMRIAIFMVAGSLADVTITACKEAPVHGGKEAIMLGSILT